MSPASNSGPQVEADPAFHRREWAVQRIMWLGLLLFLLAGGLGLFGKGPLDRATARSADLVARYERYVRHSGQSHIELQLIGGAGPGGVAQVWMEREFLDGLELRHIVPEPDHVYAGDDKTIFEFALDSTAPAPSIIFDLDPRTIGRRATWIGLGRSDSVRISQFVYP